MSRIMHRLLRVKKRIKHWRPDRQDIQFDIQEVVGILEHTLSRLDGIEGVLETKKDIEIEGQI